MADFNAHLEAYQMTFHLHRKSQLKESGITLAKNSSHLLLQVSHEDDEIHCKD
jgi:hypothetical protein